ncbi:MULTISPECIES: hypothetical protein [unclassified Bradyrhizobium]|uniref:hypothetical protein n=1 Tax=Bradyrhizobium sp. USDA 4541 TaxID=2817704 RepID=UPI0020A2F1F5|nr:hypothetical protein [Bradyrhizobium sp. USDA 4541]MCP1852764.1 hypothetical protein [Bradyrhizobium sp. USDA 4541]
MSDMRDTLIFWRRCAAYAAKGTVAFANDWAWLFGVPATVIIIQVVATGSGNSVTGSIVADALLSGAIAFAITWMVIFFVRLIGAPAALYKQAGGDVLESIPATRPLPIAITVDSLASYLRTGSRPNRLDSKIAKQGHVELNNGSTLAYGLCNDLKRLGIVDIAQLDALLEEKEELILYTATRWIFAESTPEPGVNRGQCVAELCSVLFAQLGKDPQAKRMIDDYLAAKSASRS